MGQKDLKLFYWDKLVYSYRKPYASESTTFEVQAFALATSKEHAVEILVEDFQTNILVPVRGDGLFDVERKREEFRSQLIAKRCHIHYKPVGFVVKS